MWVFSGFIRGARENLACLVSCLLCPTLDALHHIMMYQEGPHQMPAPHSYTSQSLEQ